MYKWDKDKNDLLAQTRGICFEDIVEAIDGGGILDVYEHPNQEKYPNQKNICHIGAWLYISCTVCQKRR